MASDESGSSSPVDLPAEADGKNTMRRGRAARFFCRIGLHPWRIEGGDRGGRTVYVCRVCSVLGCNS